MSKRNVPLIDISSPPQPPKLRLVESSEESESDVATQISRIQSVAERVSEIPYRPQKMSVEDAQHVVGIILLAQQLLESNVQCELIVGGEVELPMNQQGTIEREVYARIPVTPDLSVLVVNRFVFGKVMQFELKCRFNIGKRTLGGTKINTERVPYNLQRPFADEIPWAAFNETIHTEEADPFSGLKTIVFTDKPNIPLHGDSFFLSTSILGTDLNSVGTSPNDSPGGMQDLWPYQLHFYDNSFLEFAAESGDNMNGRSASYVACRGKSINVQVGNVGRPSLQNLKRATDEVVKHLTTPRRIQAALQYVIAQRQKLIE